MTGRTQKHDLLLVLGDFNAKVGCDNQGMERVTGKQVLKHQIKFSNTDHEITMDLKSNHNNKGPIELFLESILIFNSIFLQRHAQKNTSLM